MIYIDGELNVFFDCDDTLVMHDDELPKDLYIADPYMFGHTMLVRKHERHIKLLKDFKGRGYTVVVWSAGGAKWAKAVVDALEIEPYVTLCMSKPLKYIDDLQAHEIMGARIYLNEKGNIQNDQEENS
jgi:FMN phosphatase YigB (HAD superfamily)